jgi:hypothetical protein
LRSRPAARRGARAARRWGERAAAWAGSRNTAAAWGGTGSRRHPGGDRGFSLRGVGGFFGAAASLVAKQARGRGFSFPYPFYLFSNGSQVSFWGECVIGPKHPDGSI